MAGMITFPHTVLARAYTTVNLEILMDEDWDDSFFLTEGERPLDLTGKRLELWCRPTFNHTTLIRKLSTATVGAVVPAIFNEEPTKGAAYIFMPQSVVAATFVPGIWKQFLLLLEDGLSAQPLKREIWRGDLVVHPGRT